VPKGELLGGDKMGLLIKPYEISLWRDEWDATKKTFLEKRMMTIGSDKMET
jgi:hypothetical protein